MKSMPSFYLEAVLKFLALVAHHFIVHYFESFDDGMGTVNLCYFYNMISIRLFVPFFFTIFFTFGYYIIFYFVYLILN